MFSICFLADVLFKNCMGQTILSYTFVCIYQFVIISCTGIRLMISQFITTLYTSTVICLHVCSGIVHFSWVTPSQTPTFPFLPDSAEPMGITRSGLARSLPTAASIFDWCTAFMHLELYTYWMPWPVSEVPSWNTCIPVHMCMLRQKEIIKDMRPTKFSEMVGQADRSDRLASLTFWQVGEAEKFHFAETIKTTFKHWKRQSTFLKKAVQIYKNDHPKL